MNQCIKGACGTSLMLKIRKMYFEEVICASWNVLTYSFTNKRKNNEMNLQIVYIKEAPDVLRNVKEYVDCDKSEAQLTAN